VELRTRAVVRLKGAGSLFLGEAHVKEVCHRLDDAGYRTTLELIRDRPPEGAPLTRRQKMELWKVLHDWLAEAGTEELDDVVKLCEALEADLDVAQ
jgi:hypothetical protein